MAKVVVVGAGISGLSVAHSLLELYGRDKIEELVIIARDIPGTFTSYDYTSPWAGANWDSFAAPDDHAQIKRDTVTYEWFTELARSKPETGVKEYTLKLVTRKETIPWFVRDNFVRDLKQMSEEELKYRNLDPQDYHGFEFTTFTVTPSTYKFWMVNEIKKMGGKLRQLAKIDAIENIPEIVGFVPDLVINATGVHAGQFLRHYEPSEVEKVYPVKGQIVQIYEDLPFQIVVEPLPKDDNPASDQFLNMFPRGDGGCIIGGIMRKNDWSNTVDDELTKKIVEVCKRHTPELKNPTIYNSYVALRPGRKDGVRVEYSEFDLPKNQGKLKVIHNYGIGGAGYQASRGLALEASALAAANVLGLPKFISRKACPYKL
ncbi:FAD-dependent oxidoreductase [Kluyveromyces lactis]|uniref:KLLA0A08492p n=1 Tax=Kluyveromyces lactis (strain ATCC 8585 / CBS 2359 / DSM 70799 / NBRC 1267 / NRRL Y-1140 / WM37) TaxID=284590 RepID=Q6CXG4_KLULA|nr:uncharacterized protein KLLA0_A08492g [Kluyveromyces lactis]CAH02963.1 KLLA0A08492p [Kluyveromyces lactis]|eukprot:XP_451375.1 uncharacterized protein KLLA0_A08492g [Kluyveromyces lactis]